MAVSYDNSKNPFTPELFAKFPERRDAAGSMYDLIQHYRRCLTPTRNELVDTMGTEIDGKIRMKQSFHIRQRFLISK